MLKIFKYAWVFMLAAALIACSSSPNTNSQAASSGNKGEADDSKTAKSDYPTSDITFIVPYSPGGGYDTLARAAAPLLKEKLPNRPNIAVSNVAAGGGKVGVEKLFHSKPDGYTFGIMSGGAVIPQIIEDAGYDLHKMEWIGVMSIDYYITAASKKSNIRSLDDLRKKGVVKAGITGLSTIDGVSSYILADKMGFKTNAVGHKGSQEATLSALRGDVDIVTYPLNAMLNLIKDGELVPLWTSTPERIPELPNVPTLKELGYAEVAKVLILPRPLAASPGTPKERVEILRKAFKSVLENKEFKDLVVNKNQATLGTADPEKTKEVISGLFELLEPYKDLLKSANK